MTALLMISRHKDFALKVIGHSTTVDTLKTDALIYFQ